MNSIFSSFDAACFEFLHQKTASLPSMETKKNNNTAGDNKVSSPPEKQQVQKKQEDEKKTTSTRRYALELDGLNCFETIVSN
ncbi:hypothetical protein MKX01_031227 [Papaver californicum]|nr:hypothetical protein MKX01_031227 [Papaver californicum]